MSKEYVQLDYVKTALEKVVQDEGAIEKILTMLENATVVVDETGAVGVTDPSVGENPGAEGEPVDDGEPKVKNQFVIVVSDPKHQIKEELVGWVIQQPEDEDLGNVLKNIHSAAYNFNASKKGRKYPVNSVGSTLNVVSGKFFKPYGIKVKTKEPVYVVVTDNTIPKS